MEFIFLIFDFILGCFLLFLLVGYIRTWQMQHNDNQKKFLKGKIPHSLPDGFYKGSVKGYTGQWMGKTFHREKATGINVFSVGKNQAEQYPFVTSVGKGLQDKHLDVIKINYNLPKNSFFLRMILDEIVEVDKDTYLGKVHVTFIPQLPFTVGYFTLKK